MSNDFSINTSFQPIQFDKKFDNNFKDLSKNINGTSEFDKVFNSVAENPLSATISIDVDKNKTLSPVEKTVHDIGNGITNGLNDLNNVQRQAENDLETFASGGDISVHDVMISAQKSALTMQMAIQLRNKVLNAYNELKSINI